jgi:hypothetical protein
MGRSQAVGRAVGQEILGCLEVAVRDNKEANQMKNFGCKVAQALPILVALAIPSTASAAIYRSCGNAHDGGVLGQEDANYNYPYIEHGPFNIVMDGGKSQAAALARLWPVQEFGTRVKASQMPCTLAQSAAISEGNAWAHWPGNLGTARVRFYGYNPPRYPLFTVHCQGDSNYPLPIVTKLVCVGSYKGRLIENWFTISNNPNYP